MVKIAMNLMKMIHFYPGEESRNLCMNNFGCLLLIEAMYLREQDSAFLKSGE